MTEHWRNGPTTRAKHLRRSASAPFSPSEYRAASIVDQDAIETSDYVDDRPPSVVLPESVRAAHVEAIESWVTDGLGNSRPDVIRWIRTPLFLGSGNVFPVDATIDDTFIYRPSPDLAGLYVRCDDYWLLVSGGASE